MRSMDVLNVILFIINITVIYISLRVQRRLNVREAGLEGYASDLDNWDTKLKTREVALSGLLRYMDRLAELHPELKVSWVVLKREMFAGLDG